MKIMVDLDDVIFDTVGAIVRRNNEHGHPKISRHDNWGASLQFRNAVTSFYMDKTAYGRYVVPLPGAINALDALTMKHEVMIVSAYSRENTTARKVEALSQYSFTHAKRLRGCMKGMKGGFACDVAIDDQSHNLDDIRYTQKDAVLVLVDQPWNRNGTSAADIRWPGILDGNPGWPVLTRWLLDL